MVRPWEGSHLLGYLTAALCGHHWLSRSSRFGRFN